MLDQPVFSDFGKDFGKDFGAEVFSVADLQITGYFTDHLGGLHYYYKLPDGSNGPLPPQ